LISEIGVSRSRRAPSTSKISPETKKHNDRFGTLCDTDPGYRLTHLATPAFKQTEKEQADTAFGVQITKLQDSQIIDDIALGFQVTRSPRFGNDKVMLKVNLADISRERMLYVLRYCGIHGHADLAIYVSRRVAVAGGASLMMVDKKHNAESKLRLLPSSKALDDTFLCLSDWMESN